MHGNLSKSTFLKFERKISDGGGRRLLPTVGIRKLRVIAFRVVPKYMQCIVWFCYKARV